VRSHFINEFIFFTDSIELGTIGKLRQRVDEKTFIDSPANWEAFWQGINKPEPQAEALGDAGAGSNKKKRVKGEADRLRTTHFIDWVSRTNYEGKQTHYYLQDELRQDSPDLWGSNEQTFNKWLQTSEATPAKELLDRLKLEARQAV
jgi:hypothetical protein